MKYLEMVVQAFPGKDCSIEYRNVNSTLIITARVNDCYARSEFDRFERSQLKVPEDTWMTQEIEHMIHLVQREVDRLSAKRKQS